MKYDYPDFWNIGEIIVQKMARYQRDEGCLDGELNYWRALAEKRLEVEHNKKLWRMNRHPFQINNLTPHYTI